MVRFSCHLHPCLSILLLVALLCSCAAPEHVNAQGRADRPLHVAIVGAGEPNMCVWGWEESREREWEGISKAAFMLNTSRVGRKLSCLFFEERTGRRRADHCLWKEKWSWRWVWMEVTQPWSYYLKIHVGWSFCLCTGRIRDVVINDTRIELGASIYHASNLYFKSFMEQFDLEPKHPPNLGNNVDQFFIYLQEIS